MNLGWGFSILQFDAPDYIHGRYALPFQVFEALDLLQFNNTGVYIDPMAVVFEAEWLNRAVEFSATQFEIAFRQYKADIAVADYDNPPMMYDALQTTLTQPTGARGAWYGGGNRWQLQEFLTRRFGYNLPENWVISVTCDHPDLLGISMRMKPFVQFCAGVYRPAWTDPWFPYWRTRAWRESSIQCCQQAEKITE